MTVKESFKSAYEFTFMLLDKEELSDLNMLGKIILIPCIVYITAITAPLMFPLAFLISLGTKD